MTAKEKLLNDTYTKFLEISLSGIDNDRILDTIVDKDIIGFGTAIDEKVLSFSEFQTMLKIQKEQSQGLNISFKSNPNRHFITETGNTAVFSDDLFLTVTLENETLEIYLRFSVVLEYRDNKWIVINFHGSKPEYVDNETDTFGVDIWKQKNAELKKLVEERTTELSEKNRELEIETALEKVRSVAMGMKSPADMVEVCKTISHQLQNLGVTAIRNVQTAIFYESRGTYMNYVYYTLHNKTTILETDYTNHPIQQEFAKKMLKGKGELSISYLKDNEVKDWLEYQKTTNVYIDSYLENASSLNYYWYSLGVVAMGISTYVPLKKENQFLFERFRNVFELAYSRYLDIQNAIAQAREAKIETALERVRSRSMAMHHTNELQEVIHTMHQELLYLNIAVNGGSFIVINKEVGQEIVCWGSGDTANVSDKIIIPRFDKPFYLNLLNGIKTRKEFFTEEFTQDEKKEFFTFLLKHKPWSNLSEKEKEEVLSTSGGYTRSCCVSKYTSIFIVNHFGKKYSDHENEILKRFAKVFEQTYTRFLDLQKAEAQAREAEIELALERVRARTMAMQHSDELAEASFLLDSQVRALGIKTRGCAFNIYGENDSTEWFSSEMGTMPTYKTPREKVFLDYYKAGQKAETFLTREFSGKECIDWYNYLCTLPKLGDGLKQMIASGGSFPTRQIDHVSFFKYGYLLFITLEPAPDAHEIFIRFAKVFEQTYTRFLDLQKAEAQAVRAEHDIIEIKNARKKAEDALTALKSTQTQLIQSEKMASLGELTAGIAHEIQNPLNFVNNFSEVSAELLAEMNAELEKGDIEEAKAIANDVIDNLGKINHHGKRADAIVKGMLQHSRSSAGVLELTNLNALCDEYLRLSYYGLRAKDKSFNATMKTDFDKSIGKINIIPQDFGRVILNLLNNAFYAVNEKSHLNIQGYEPTVSLATKKENDKIIISVSDNGNGMPQEIIDKIFQPFFTTKPTGQGTGLGLSMSYDIITKGHAGELKVTSKENEGTTFSVILPI